MCGWISDESVGWAEERSDVPTIYHRARCKMVGTMRFAHPTAAVISDRKTGPAATRRGGGRIDHAERRADQIIDEIDFGAREERHRGRVDQNHRALARDHQVIFGL